MKNQADWAVLPYNSKKINNNYLVSNFYGSWSLLSRQDFLTLEQFTIPENSPLFNRLYQEGIIVKEEKIPELTNQFRQIHSHLYTDTSLHIAVVTTRCNLKCNYCQTKVEQPQDMDFAVAARILKYIFDVRNQQINLEFQGGEPLLNWKMVKFMIENARRINTAGKDLVLSLVTNGTYLDQEKIDFLLDNNVSICISLDGPAAIHNKNRVLNNNQATYDKVITAIKRLKKAYQKRKINKSLDLLLTVTRYSLPFAEKIIDEYVKLGAERIALRPINKIGLADKQWGVLGYSAQEFNNFWAGAMEYILKLNKKGVKLQERMASVMLQKILKKANPGYVDLMSPCGAGRCVLAYMPNGDVYPCDEARMIGNDIFKLGNVLNNDYEEIMKSSTLFCVCEASLTELWDYNSAFLPWTGTCPVLNYLQGDNLVPKIRATPLYQIYNFQFEYLFKKISEKENRDIFLQWTK